jgi:hypothetical protein
MLGVEDKKLKTNIQFVAKLSKFLQMFLFTKVFYSIKPERTIKNTSFGGINKVFNNSSYPKKGALDYFCTLKIQNLGQGIVPYTVIGKIMLKFFPRFGRLLKDQIYFEK